MKKLTQYLYEAVNKPARIFIIIKPGFFQYAQQILEMFADEGWGIEKQKSKKLLESEAKQLYKIHKDEEWYNDLVEYMSSDITTAYILINKDLQMSHEIFDKISSLKDKIRDKWGKNESENVMHSSDSLEHMIQEQSIYF